MSPRAVFVVAFWALIAEWRLVYIDTWSMLQDLKVLARTVPVALGASGR